MTVVRNSHSLRTVLDFSGEHYSKNQIRKALRALRFTTVEQSNDGERCFIHNVIKVGMYEVHIVTNPQEGKLRLRDLGVLLISINEVNGKLPINLDKDGRFKRQYWVEHNINSTLRVNHLVDVIAHCRRLDGLKAFL